MMSLKLEIGPDKTKLFATILIFRKYKAKSFYSTKIIESV